MRPSNKLGIPLALSAAIIGLALLVGISVSVASGGVSLRPRSRAANELPTLQPSPTLTLEPTATATVQVAPILGPTVTRTPAPPLPTETPTMTPTPEPGAPTYTPSPTPPPTFTPSASGPVADVAGDFADYETLAPRTLNAAGADIAAACFSSEKRLLEAVPPQITESAPPTTEGAENLLLWMSLHEAAPEDPTVISYWLFALDVDGNVSTGRPVDDGIINPDFGTEVIAGVYSDPQNEVYFTPYLLIWDASLNDLERQTFDMQATFTPDRQAVILTLPREALEELVRTRSGVEPDWGQASGRAATLTGTAEGMVVDFCPDLPAP